ncbi:MAG: class I SAM-dependent methyltransferase [Planctomycetaceae bacterium]
MDNLQRGVTAGLRAEPEDLTGIRCQRVPCALCGAADSHRIWRMTDVHCGVPGEFDIVRCAVCGHMFLNPRPVNDHLGRCYPEDYGPHQSQVSDGQAQEAESQGAESQGAESQGSGTADLSAERPWYLRVIPLRHVPGLKRLYLWLLDDRSQPVPEATDAGGGSAARALELGCATGTYLQKLKAAGWQAVGVEPSEKAALKARSAGLTVQTGTLDTIEFSPDDVFDLAAAWMVLEHVPDPAATLRQLFGVIRPGGKLLFSIPNAGCWEAIVFGRHWYAWEPPRHLHHFTPDSIRRLLTQAGFDDIRVTHQRNLSYVIGSLGLLFLSIRPSCRVGQRLRDFPGKPRLFIQLMLAPWAHLLAWLHQGGRLTICATRPDNGGDFHQAEPRQ